MEHLRKDDHHSNGNGGDHNKTNTVNHFYFLSDYGPNSIKNWMEKIGTILHMGSDRMNIKPIVELIVTAICPERIFVINHQSRPEHQLESFTEILVILADEDDSSNDQNVNFVKLAFSHQKDLFISVGDAFEIEGNLTFGSAYECSHFRPRFQVYSTKPTPIIEMDQNQLDKLKSETADRFQRLFHRAQILFNNASDFLKENNTDLGALMLNQTLLLIYQSIINAFCGPAPEIYTTIEYQKVAKMFLPLIVRNDRLAKLPERLEQTCILQGEPSYRNSKAAIDLLFDDIQMLINICEVGFCAKLGQFDPVPVS